MPRFPSAAPRPYHRWQQQRFLRRRPIAALTVLAAATAAVALGLLVAPAAVTPALAQSPPPTGSPSAATSAPIRPDPRRTPGDTLAVTLEDIRTPGYSSRVRNVPIEVKRQVYASYGITRHAKGEYEVDHLIPLSIGGSNSVKNLWPQSYLTQPWNAHVKDALEYRLLELVRAGKLDLKTAQQDIARDWIAAYQKYIGPEPRREHTSGQGIPASPDRQPDLNPPATTAATTPAPPSSAGSSSEQQQVWVNTKSGVFHGPQSRYYGKTREGKYMSEADALAAGYHADPGERR